MKLPAFVKIREVGPRDGFQSLETVIPLNEKLEIIDTLIRAGVPEVEATSFASVRALPQFQDAPEVLARISRGHAALSAMVFGESGARRALTAGANRLVTVVSASQRHNRANTKRSIEASLSKLKGVFKAARDHKRPVTGAVAVAFGCPFQGAVAEKAVFEIAEAFISKGADSIILADTVGLAVPDQVEERVKGFQRQFAQTELILHFHNNRGTAMANLLAALLAGATVFDTALAGLGGCPYVPRAAGNIPTEDAVSMLEGMEIDTGIHLETLLAAARRLECIVGHTLPGQVMKSGPRGINSTGPGKPRQIPGRR